MASQNIEMEDCEESNILECEHSYERLNMGNELTLSWKQWLKFLLLTLTVCLVFSGLVLAITYSTLHAELRVNMEKTYEVLMKTQNCSATETNALTSGKEKEETLKKPAFLARLKPRTDSVTLRSNSVVKFNAITTNIGSGYDSNTGVFTVPLNGTYEFAVNFVKGNKTQWLELQLMKNNRRIVRGHAAYDTYSSGSLQVILELEEGDRIYVLQPRSSGDLYGHDYTMFSGHFI